jgi:hypothetical protein
MPLGAYSKYGPFIDSSTLVEQKFDRGYMTMLYRVMYGGLASSIKQVCYVALRRAAVYNLLNPGNHT